MEPLAKYTLYQLQLYAREQRLVINTSWKKAYLLEYIYSEITKPPFERRKPSSHQRIGKILSEAHPEVARLWHPDNDITPDQVSPGSNYKAKWQCPGDGVCSCHVYYAVIGKVVDAWKNYQGNRCPFCKGYCVCPHNNLAARFPELAKEWHPSNEGRPEDYSCGSKKVVSWICKDNHCGCHVFKTAIKCRTRPDTPNGCPFCLKRKPCPHNRLDYLFPELVKEWDYERNAYPPSSYPPGSGEEVHWICPNRHRWMSRIVRRTGKHKGDCPHCYSGRYSKAAMSWLSSLESKYRIKIRHGLNGGEKYVDGMYFDGFCEEYNIAFEFHGDYWHGHPVRYSPDGYNNISNKTFSELYEKTVKRDKRIVELGYRLIVHWETDYPEYPIGLREEDLLSILPKRRCRIIIVSKT